MGGIGRSLAYEVCGTFIDCLQNDARDLFSISMKPLTMETRRITRTLDHGRWHLTSKSHMRDSERYVKFKKKIDMIG